MPRDLLLLVGGLTDASKHWSVGHTVISSSYRQQHQFALDALNTPLPVNYTSKSAFTQETLVHYFFLFDHQRPSR